MALTNKEMITEIRSQLNVVNQGLIDPDKFTEANHEDIETIYQFVMSKQSFTPSEVTAIANELGQLRD
ncbi:DUF1128 domain-containing protein [Staphylococcus auricularis]|uniref:DUF1128 domain-containing protein n=1 Tax=Staphylococcus auricularis TaxID=29379 RepID=UPI003EBD57D8